MKTALRTFLSVAEEVLWLAVDALTSDARLSFALFSAVVGIAHLVEEPGAYHTWIPLWVAAIALGRTISNGSRLTVWGRVAALVSVTCYSWLAIESYLDSNFHATTVYWTFSIFLIAEVATRRKRTSIQKSKGRTDDGRDSDLSPVAHRGSRWRWRPGPRETTND